MLRSAYAKGKSLDRSLSLKLVNSKRYRFLLLQDIISTNQNYTSLPLKSHLQCKNERKFI